MRFSAVLAGNELYELIAVFVEPFGFSANHQEEIGAVEVSEEAGRGDWQYRLFPDVPHVMEKAKWGIICISLERMKQPGP